MLSVHEETIGVGQVAGGKLGKHRRKHMPHRRLSGKSVIEMFDTAGRRCVYTTTSSDSYSHQLPSGTYIVRVRTSNKDYTNKINVR